MILRAMLGLLFVFSLYSQDRKRTDEQQYKLSYIDKTNRNSITNFYERCYSLGGKVPSDRKSMISFENKGINSLRGISQFFETPVLFLDKNPFEDIDEIKKLVNLKKLWLSHTDISSVSSLNNLDNLEELAIDGTNVKRIIKLPKNIKLLYVDNDVSDLKEFLKARKECKAFKFEDRNPINPEVKCRVFVSSDYKKLGKGCKNNKKIDCKKTAKPLPDKSCERQPDRTDDWNLSCFQQSGRRLAGNNPMQNGIKSKIGNRAVESSSFYS